MYSGSAVTTISGLDHLEGETVVVWGWNTVTPFHGDIAGWFDADGRQGFRHVHGPGGSITGLSSAVTDACVGLGYEATFKSAKLAYAAQMGTALNQSKKIDQVGLILANTHMPGPGIRPVVRCDGRLPLVEDGDTTDTNLVWE
jgi:hypothetical protein